MWTLFFFGNIRLCAAFALFYKQRFLCHQEIKQILVIQTAKGQTRTTGLVCCCGYTQYTQFSYSCSVHSNQDRASGIKANRCFLKSKFCNSFWDMRASAKKRTAEAFRNSFGLPTDSFPTLLASTVSPFAFWYEDDPAGGCVRFPTETECERLMGLPEGWTKYGADGEEILPAHRYRALGNAIALPCAEYIMRGIYDVLTRRC